MRKLINIFKSTILCLKYPFLYPRNCWTGNHWDSIKITQKIRELENKYTLNLTYTVITEKEFEEERNKTTNNCITIFSDKIEKNGHSLKVLKMYKHFMILYKDKKLLAFLPISDYIKGDNIETAIKKVIFYKRVRTTVSHKNLENIQLYFVLNNKYEKKDYHSGFNTINITLSKTFKYKIKLWKCLNKFLAIFHLLPSYTELDEMPVGWRKRFGEDICKEIRNSLIFTCIKLEHPKTFLQKLKCLYKGIRLLQNYRIMQIKEKFGGLRWYTNGDTKETFEIIQKYEDISKKTCIVCGNNATHISTGWICPYCSKHKPENSTKLKTIEKK